MRYALVLAAALLATIVAAPARAGSCDAARAVLKQDPLVKILWDDTLVSSLPSLDGGLTVLCGEPAATDLEVYANRRDPGDAFISYAADLAHRLTGVSAKDASKLMRECYAREIKRQAEHGTLPYGLQYIEIKNRIHVDCKVGDANSGFGIFNRSGLDED